MPAEAKKAKAGVRAFKRIWYNNGMELPYYVFLIIYLVVIGIFMLFAFLNMYHLMRFGMFDLRTKIIALFFVLISIAIIAISIYLLRDIVWQDTISIPLSL